MKKIYLFFMIGLTAFSQIAMARDGCGPGHPQPRGNSYAGGDRPDDTVDVSTVDGVRLHPSGYALVAILQNGYYDQMALLLEKIKEPYAIHSSLPSGTARDHPILIIPSGGLYGLEGSSIFREGLARYASEGGTIICFFQQRGYEFSCLPTGKVEGAGWREDQSCWTNAAYIETPHPMFSSQPGLYVTANIDGYFTAWPGSTTILLMRTKNKLPAMLMYPFGKGMVIASTLYSDQGFSYSHISSDEIALIRDIITWAKKPEEKIPEFSQGSQTELSITLANLSTQTAKNVQITILNPDKSFSTSSISSLPSSIPSNSFSTYTFNYTLPDTLGIYTIAYTLLDNSNNPIQKEIQAERFAVAKPYEGAKPTPGFSLSVSTPGEELIADSDVEFKVIIYNNTNVGGTITGNWFIPLHSSGGFGPVFVPANTSTETYIRVRITSHYSVWRFWLHTNIGVQSLGGQVIKPTIGMELTTSKDEYERKEGGTITLLVFNRKNAQYNVRVNLSCILAGLNKTFELSLRPLGSLTEIATFTVPEKSMGGISVVKAFAYVNEERVCESFATFKVPPASLLVKPILPNFWGTTNSVSFNIESYGYEIPPGSLSLILSDTKGKLFETSTSIGTISSGQEATIITNIPIQPIKFFETYKLFYFIKNGVKDVSGQIEIKNQNIIKCEFDQPFYSIRESIKATSSIINTGNFKQDLSLVLSIPDCNFTETNTFVLYPGSQNTIGYSPYIPDTVKDGKHKVYLSLTMGSETFVKSYEFFIPPEKLILQDFSSNSFTLKNIGGVDGSYTVYSKVIDSRNMSIFETQTSIYLWPGSETSIRLIIPDQALDGNYILGITAIDNEGERTIFNRSIKIEGILGDLEANPKSRIYMSGGTLSAINTIANLKNKDIENATLTLSAYAAISDWVSYSNIKNINDIVLDGDIIWLATNGGLIEYNKTGNLYNLYTTINGLCGNDLTSIAKDGNELWIASRENGVSRYNKLNKKFTNYTSNDGLNNNNVRSVLVDNGYIWFGTWEGASRYDQWNNVWKTYYPGQTQPGNYINAIAKDGNFLWFATYDGAFRLNLDNEEITHYSTEDGLAHSYVLSIGIDGNYIWFGHPDGSASMYDKANNFWRVYTTSGYQQGNEVLDISALGNSVWFATQKGASKYDKPSDTWQTFVDGLASLKNTSCAIDENNVWLGGEDGLSKYEPISGWGSYTTADGLISNEVSSVFNEGDYIYLGTNRGLSRYDKKNKTWSQFNEKDGILGEKIKALARGGGYLWAITDKAICRGNTNFDAFPYNTALLPFGGDLDFHSIVDFGGYVWFAGYNGLIRFRNEQWERLPFNKVNDIASYGSNLYLATPYGAIEYNGITYLQGENIISLACNDNYLWFGTEQGLKRYSRKTGEWKVWTTSDGLPDNHIGKMLIKENYLWVSTYKGIACYDLEDNTWKTYTKSDGLPSNYCLDMDSDDKSLWFATQDGIAQFSIKGNLLAETNTLISLSANSTTTTTIEVGTVTGGGKAYLEAILKSAIGQIIDESEKGFYIFGTGSVYVAILPEKPVYKRGEIATLTIYIENFLPSTFTNCFLSLTKNGVEIFKTGSFEITDYETYSFKTTTIAEETFILEAILSGGSKGFQIQSTVDEKTREKIEVIPPSLQVIIDAPNIVKRGDFDVSISLKNTSPYPINLGLIMDAEGNIRDFGTLSLIPERSQLFQATSSFTSDGTITAIVYGDVFATYTKGIIFGERIDVKTEPKDLYPEGTTTIPFTLENKGEFSSNISLEFILQKLNLSKGINVQWCKAPPKIRLKSQKRGMGIMQANYSYGDGSVTVKEDFYIPKGEAISGELIYELISGNYGLTHSSFFGTGTKSFKVSQFNVVDLTINAPEKLIGLVDGRLSFDILVENKGGNEFVGGISIDSGFLKEEKQIRLPISGTSTISFSGTPTATQGTYTIIAQALYNGSPITTKTTTIVLIPQFSLLAISPSTFTLSQIETITIFVKNNGSGEGNARVNVKILDFIDETKQIWLSSNQEGSLTFSFLIPDDLEERDYSGEARLSTGEGIELETKIIPFHLNGIHIKVSGYLDRDAYNIGETATLRIAIQNVAFSTQTLNLLAKVHYADYNGTFAFTISTETTLTFPVFIPSFVSQKLYFGIYTYGTEAGRSLYINNLYLYEKQATISLTLDKQIYEAGGTMSILVFSSENGTLSLMSPGEEKEVNINGTSTIVLKIPSNLTSGTYWLYYAFLMGTETIRGNIRFDVIGISLKVIESRFDKEIYRPSDEIKLTLKVEMNRKIKGIIRGWIKEKSVSHLFFEKRVNLDVGENLVEIQGTITSLIPGEYSITYGFYLLTSGGMLLSVDEEETLLIMEEAIFTLENEVGTLSITSIPPRAEVFIDGTDTYQTTPATITNVLLGTHSIKLTLEGYEDWFGSATIISTETTYIMATLTKIFGTITGTITYNGTKTGTLHYAAFDNSGFQGEPIAAGTATLNGTQASYTFSIGTPGTYYIGAYLGTDTLSIGDPIGIYGSLTAVYLLDGTVTIVGTPIPVSITPGSTIKNINFGLSHIIQSSFGTITGIITYFGPSSGTLYYVIFDNLQFQDDPKYQGTQTFQGPGSISYSLQVSPGTYYISAFLSTNNDEDGNLGEPIGGYGTFTGVYLFGTSTSGGSVTIIGTPTPVYVELGSTTENISFPLSTVFVATPTDLWIEKYGSSTITYGEITTYTITFGNKGSITAYNVQIIDTLPFDFNLIGSTGSWNINKLEKDETGTITIWGTFSSIGTITNYATITCIPSTDENPTNNSTSATTYVVTGPPATITLTANPKEIIADKGTTTAIAYVKDQYNNPVPDGTIVNWSTSYGTLSSSTSTTTNGTATIVIEGLIKIGTYTITGSISSSLMATTTIIVDHGTITALNLEPKAASLTADGSLTLTAIANDNDGNTWTVQAEFTENDPIGTISENIYYPGKVGTWTITGTYSGKVAQATVTVKMGSITTIKIVNSEDQEIGIITLNLNETLSLYLRGYDNDENKAYLSGTWMASGLVGTLNPTMGTYTIFSPATASTGTISVSYDSLTDETGLITITEAIYSISGIVWDVLTGNPIKDAGVRIENSTATTNKDGTYTIPGLNLGTYTLVVTKEGYFPATRTVEVRSQKSEVRSQNVGICPTIRHIPANTWVMFSPPSLPESKTSIAKLSQVLIGTMPLTPIISQNTINIGEDLGIIDNLGKLEFRVYRWQPNEKEDEFFAKYRRPG
ncbi:MAG: PEGA domain-containing protein, partial [bacterium]